MAVEKWWCGRCRKVVTPVECKPKWQDFGKYGQECPECRNSYTLTLSMPVSVYEEEKAKLVLALADAYSESNKAASTVARLCDEYLDRSGALLGKVRLTAREL